MPVKVRPRKGASCGRPCSRTVMSLLCEEEKWDVIMVEGGTEDAKAWQKEVAAWRWAVRVSWGS